LQIIDVSNPGKPTLRGSYYVNNDAVNDVFIADNLAYITTAIYGLEIVDVSNPAVPKRRGGYALAKGEATDITVSGQLAYVAAFSGGLLILDVSDPANPTLYSAYTNGANIQGVQLSGPLAYVIGGGLDILDVNNPASPQHIGSYDAPQIATDVQLLGRFAYVLDTDHLFDGSWLRVLEVDDPTNPFMLNWTSSMSMTGSRASKLLRHVK